MRPTSGLTVTPAQIAERLRSERKVLAVTHEAPDGDALGCLSAFLAITNGLGIKSRSYIPGDSPLPDEYSFMRNLNAVSREIPEIDSETTIYALDCASLGRSNGHQMPAGSFLVNIDHHQDNPGYGDWNLVDPRAASATAVFYEVLKAGGFAIDVHIATALYVGLVTDTGRFQYSNTDPAAHRMAAELQEAGVDVNYVYRKVYESTPLPKLMLLQHALAHLEILLDGALVVSWLGPEDFTQVEAEDGHSEGIIDTLRKIRGAKVAALVKERVSGDGTKCKVSLRATDGAVNVAEIAAKRGGGGHIRAAGFNCDGGTGAVIEWIESEVRASL